MFFDVIAGKLYLYLKRVFLLPEILKCPSFTLETKGTKRASVQGKQPHQ